MPRFLLPGLLSVVLHAAVFMVWPNTEQPTVEQPVAAMSLAALPRLVAAAQPPAPEVTPPPPEPAPPVPIAPAKPKPVLAAKPAPAKPKPVHKPMVVAKPAVEPVQPQLEPPPQPIAQQPVKPVQVAKPAPVQEVLVSKPRFAAPPQAPEYPMQARRRKQEGVVLVEVRLDARGSQRARAVLKSSGFPALDEAALDAVARWQFLPEQNNGLGVPSRVQIPVRFALARR